MTTEVRYVIGVAAGALLGVMLGIPSFSVDQDTESAPPLFSIYCDTFRSPFAGECVPSGSGIILMLLVGAGVGALAAAALGRLWPTPQQDEGGDADGGSPDKRGALGAVLVQARGRIAAVAQAAGEQRTVSHQSQRSAQTQRSAPSDAGGAPSDVTLAAIDEARSRAAAAAQTAGDQHTPDGAVVSGGDVVLQAAFEISAAVEQRRDSVVRMILSVDNPYAISEEETRRKETIERRLAWTHISDDVREHAQRLGIINLASTAVDRAVEMGWLTSHGTGSKQVLSRTSDPLQAPTPPQPTGGSDQSTAAAPSAESPHQDPVELSEQPDPATDAASSAAEAAATDAASSAAEAAGPEPMMEQYESLIRLHERGVLTDAELQAAKSRLFSDAGR